MSQRPTLKSEEPTVVEGLRCREARATRASALAGRDAKGEAGATLNGRCVTCGATAHDWRRLLGVATQTATWGTGTMVLTYPGACSKCGASNLAVN
jgi:Fe-S cluster biogenesis protein NfuA